LDCSHGWSAVGRKADAAQPVDRAGAWYCPGGAEESLLHGATAIDWRALLLRPSGAEFKFSPLNHGLRVGRRGPSPRRSTRGYIPMPLRGWSTGSIGATSHSRVIALRLRFTGDNCRFFTDSGRLGNEAL